MQQESTNAPIESHVIGIDLGTTNSAVACLDDAGNPYTIRNRDGQLLTPTAILVDGQEIVVGLEAAAAAATDPTSYADCFKRDIGAAAYRREVCGVQVPPQVLSALVLQQLKEDAEHHLGPVQKAVITVPAFFDETRRKATQDAGRLAGLDVLDIINEPTAAALAYGYRQGLLNGSRDESPMQRVLVYDLGGGTFDVTILELNSQSFRAIATDGDVQLGGKDFDARIVDYLAEQFVEAHGLDPRRDPHDAAQLWIDAQRLKHTLSSRKRASAALHHAGKRLNIELTREQFGQLTHDLIEQTETTVGLVIGEAGLSWKDIDHVITVGGSCRMPAVAEMLQRKSGKDVDTSLSPDEAIAFGAAIHASMLARRHGDHLHHRELVNVNSHSLGVRGVDPKSGQFVNAIMIPRNSPLPCQAGKVFSTIRDDQRSVRVVVLEGESRQPEGCIRLGECVIRNLPAGLPKGSKIEVRYQYEANGRLKVAARLPGTQQSAQVQIHRHGASDLETLVHWRERLTSAASSSETNTTDDLGSILRRIDDRCRTVGQAALTTKVSSAVQHLQHHSIEAIKDYKAATESLRLAEHRIQSATSRSELAHASSEAAKCQLEFDRAQTRARFSVIALGRECIKHHCVPDAASAAADEVRKLRERNGI